MLLAAMWLFSSSATLAQTSAPNEAERVARAYVAAYSAANWDGMAQYMGDEFVLIDRTNPDPNFTPEYRSREAALAMLRRFGTEGGIIELGFEFPVVFESNGIVVFQGHVNTFGAPPGRDFAYRWRAQQVTVLTIRNGRVVRHEDFANYAAPTVTRVPRPATP
ncbi:MAG: nuclear transport factor 2 family protein [Alphaproteobacteria bacterium]